MNQIIFKTTSLAFQAKEMYEQARNTRAFRVTGHYAVFKNGYGAKYLFLDDSWLTVSHYSNEISWGLEDEENGKRTFACRALWDDRPTGQARRKAQKEQRT